MRSSSNGTQAAAATSAASATSGSAGSAAKTNRKSWWAWAGSPRRALAGNRVGVDVDRHGPVRVGAEHRPDGEADLLPHLPAGRVGGQFAGLDVPAGG